MISKKIDKIYFSIWRQIATVISPKYATNFQYSFLKNRGMKFSGKPKYLSCKIWFDGTDYSLISIGNGVTMSSYIRILTHDWALHTVSKSLGFIYNDKNPKGRILGIEIGDYSFIGTGTILMPGTIIGKGCIIAAGTVTRGKIPDYSIYAGSPGKVIGDVRTYFEKHEKNYKKYT